MIYVQGVKSKSFNDKRTLLEQLDHAFVRIRKETLIKYTAEDVDTFLQQGTRYEPPAVVQSRWLREIHRVIRIMQRKKMHADINRAMDLQSLELIERYQCKNLKTEEDLHVGIFYALCKALDPPH